MQSETARMTATAQWRGPGRALVVEATAVMHVGMRVCMQRKNKDSKQQPDAGMALGAMALRSQPLPGAFCHGTCMVNSHETASEN